MRERYRKIAFLGLGCVGSCNAAAYAARGFESIGIDIDPQRVEAVSFGKAQFQSQA